MILEGYESVASVADAADAMEALSLMNETNSDLVLLDINLPDLNGINLLRELRKQFPRTKVLMLSSSRRTSDIMHAFGAGASGYCCKGVDIDDSLKRALRSLCSGQFWLDPCAAKQLGAVRKIDSDSEHNLFTEKESALLNEIATHQSDVSEMSNQKIMAGIVAKMRKLAA
jgi:two-component system response regulator DegU